METRQSRMDKYFEAGEEENNVEESQVFSSRMQKNQELYKQVSSLEIEGFDLNSNSTVLDVNAFDIDIDDVKEQLEEKYHENPRNKSFGDTDEINLPKINLDETREYDINAILAKAKEEKEINYEEDRHRKVSDVLKDIEEYTQSIKSNREEEIEDNDEEDEELRKLIDTINARELIEEEENLEVTGDMDPFDLLGDLKGDDDNTRVMGQLTDELEEETSTDELTRDEIEQISEIEEDSIFKDDDTEEIEEQLEEISEKIDEKIDEKNEEEIEEEPIIKEKKKKKKEQELNNSFIKTANINTADFDEFDDLKDDMKATKVIIKILIVIIVLVFIAGLLVLANSKFNWGLFK